MRSFEYNAWIYDSTQNSAQATFRTNIFTHKLYLAVQFSPYTLHLRNYVAPSSSIPVVVGSHGGKAVHTAVSLSCV